MQGRNGRTRSADGSLDLALSMPEAMGGPGGDGTNPEQLFALGYAACFANAMRSWPAATGDETVVEGATVTAHVDIGAIGGGRFGLAVDARRRRPDARAGRRRGARGQGARALPVLNATRGNIPVELAVRGGAAVSTRRERDRSPRTNGTSRGEADLGHAQASNPADDPDMIRPDADPLDTDVEDADLFLGFDDDDGEDDVEA